MWQLEEIKKRTPDIRKLFDIWEVVYDKKWVERQRNIELYYMYRNVAKVEDQKKIENLGLRYDVTVIPPLMMGCEFVKTAGHYHPLATKNLSYPEIYQVLQGEATFLIQRVEGKEVKEVYYSECKEGEIFIIPPNFGHVTINPSKERLVIANWVSSNFKSVYEPFKRMEGACYFLLKNGWKKNENYRNVPRLRKKNGKREEDIYGWINEESKLDFLNNPEEFF